MNTYDFGSTSFMNYVWINKGQTFSNPQGLDIEMTEPGAFQLEVYDQRGIFVVRCGKRGERAGWSSFYFDGLGTDDEGNVLVLTPGAYMLKLVNKGSGKRIARGGSLRYG
jgi:hypothetical protein